MEDDPELIMASSITNGLTKIYNSKLQLHTFKSRINQMFETPIVNQWI